MDPFKDGSGARLRDVGQHEIVDMTVCFRFFFFAKDDSHMIIHSKLDKDPLSEWKAIFAVEDWIDKNHDSRPTTSFGLRSDWIRAYIDCPVMIWYHMCLSNNASSMTVVSNGKTISENLGSGNKPMPKEFLSNMFIMRASTPEETEEKQFYSMFGKMTDVNIWNYSMTVEEMKSWTNCKNKYGGGNVVNWETAEWTTWYLEVEILDKSELCRKEEHGLTIFPQERPFMKSVELCKRLGGTMAVANSETKSQEMIALREEWKDNCTGDNIWAGYTDRKEEGVFVDVNSGENMPWSNWEPGEPRGLGHCARLKTDGQLDDGPCSRRKYCTLCQMEKEPVLQLRGSCPEEGLDLEYTMILNQNKSTKFYDILGWRKTILTWNDTKWSFFNRLTKGRDYK